MQSKKIFGDYVKNRRIEVGLTQKEFADKLYVTESAVSKWERGLSYPDITLITVICEILGVSEHELFTASDDIKIHNQERLAKRYLNLIKRLKMIQIILFGVSLLTCFIVNLAVSHKLSWFFIVLTAEIVMSSLTLLPTYFKKKRGLITLGGFFVTLNILLATISIYTRGNWFGLTFVAILLGLSLIFLPFVLSSFDVSLTILRHKTLVYMAINTLLLLVLLLVIAIFSGGDWLFDTAYPIALCALLFPWSCTMLVRYIPLNRFLKAAICLFLAAVLLYFMENLVNMILGDPYKFFIPFNFANWSNADMISGNVVMIVVFSFVLLSAVFLSIGLLRLGQKQSPQ